MLKWQYKVIFSILVLIFFLVCGCIDIKTKDTSKTVMGKEFSIVDAIYSPDGNYIVFASMMDGGLDYEIYMGEYEWQDIVQITDDDVDNLDPAMSPDSSSIVFSTNDPELNAWNLWEYSFLNDSIRQLTSGTFNDTCPVYSEDGDNIFFLRQEDNPSDWQLFYQPPPRANNTWKLYLSNLTSQRIYSTGYDCHNPAILKGSDDLVLATRTPFAVGLIGPFYEADIISNNGNYNRTINCTWYNMNYAYSIMNAYSIDTENLLLLASDNPWYIPRYGDCVLYHNLLTNRSIVLLSKPEYRIDRLSYSQNSNKILLSCWNNGSFVNELDLDIKDENMNNISDSIELDEKKDLWPYPYLKGMNNRMDDDPLSPWNIFLIIIFNPFCMIAYFVLFILILIFLYTRQFGIKRKPDSKGRPRKNQKKEEPVEATIIEESE